MPTSSTRAPLFFERSMIAPRLAFICASGRPRRPSLAPSSTITTAGRWRASAASMRAAPPALLAGLDTPTSGTVELDGVDLFSLDEDRRAELRGRMLGFVFQSFQLLPALTALENVMLPLELADRADAEDLARQMLVRVGLGERLNHYPKHLSGGEQQRVALARAFVVRPKLLLADEPTGSLDADSGAGVIRLLFDLNREYGTTLVMVTHDESLAGRCGRMLRLAAGRIVG